MPPRPSANLHVSRRKSRRRHAKEGWLLAALALGVVFALIASPMLRSALNAFGALAEVAILAVAAAAAGYASWHMHRRRERAEAAMRAAANNDAFWCPDSFKAQVEALFEPYWRAVQQQNVAAIADQLSPYWHETMLATFAEWRARSWKPVLIELSLSRVGIVGLEDWRDDRRDQVTALIECFNSYHVTDTRAGEPVEGQPMARNEMQLWRFVRRPDGWRLNDVEIVEEGAACDRRVFREQEVPGIRQVTRENHD